MTGARTPPYGDRRQRMTEAAGSDTDTGRIVLGRNNYGKSGVRIVKVKRGVDRHELWDLDVAVALEGDFETAHVDGDNSQLLATDTMRNTIYALAKDHLTGSIEEFALALVDHFLEAGPTVERARVAITRFPWDRIEVNGQGHEHSFVRGAGERTARITGDEGDRRVEAGLDNLLVMKTTASGWEGFFRDGFTTLADTNDRILATSVTADWSYGRAADLDFDGLWGGVRDRILATFTDHYSPSVQNTLYRIGKAVLEEYPEVEKIRLSFPNKHHIPYDLSRFGVENEGEIFWATDEPYGLIEGTVERER
jgi:urate oxidase